MSGPYGNALYCFLSRWYQRHRHRRNQWEEVSLTLILLGCHIAEEMKDRWVHHRSTLAEARQDRHQSYLEQALMDPSRIVADSQGVTIQQLIEYVFGL